jgi:steroid 5-alpha reductase family enzyme
MASDVVRGIVVNSIGLSILFSVAWGLELTWLASVAVAINYGVFLGHALPQASEKFFDATGSLTYLCLVIAATVRSHGRFVTRQILLPIMVCIWCIRLGSFLLARILKDGKDSRFDELKRTPIRFLSVWTIQSLWCFLVASPALVAVTSEACSTCPTGVLDVVGWSIWFGAFGFEVIADRQKEAFRKDPANNGKFITIGLWAYSRHPNYFGEIMMWIGICISGSACFHGSQWLAWLSPVTTAFLLLKVSGVPLLEAKGEKTWGSDPAYQWYMQTTPCIVPSLRPPPRFTPSAVPLLEQK